MSQNKQFIETIRQLISEEIRKRNPLLESPVKTEGEILVESRARKILKATKSK
jgi:hypothetical protein